MKIRTLAILLILTILPFAMPAAAQTPGLRGQGNSPRRGRQQIAGGDNPRKAGILSHRKPRRGGRMTGGGDGRQGTGRKVRIISALCANLLRIILVMWQIPLRFSSSLSHFSPILEHVFSFFSTNFDFFCIFARLNPCGKTTSSPTQPYETQYFI